jgi:hypothetical protein
MNAKQQSDDGGVRSDSWRRRAHEAGATVAGAVAGAAMGAIAGPPGALVGAVIGGAIGAVVAKTLEDESTDHIARNKRLDNEVGIFRTGVDEPILLATRRRRRALPPSERRGDPRHPACLPVYVEREASSPHASMTRDISATGALLLGRQDLLPGERVKLQIFILEHLTEFRETMGWVVRSGPLDDDRVALWSCQIAVQFEEPLVMCEAETRALEHRERLHSMR